MRAVGLWLAVLMLSAFTVVTAAEGTGHIRTHTHTHTHSSGSVAENVTETGRTEQQADQTLELLAQAGENAPQPQVFTLQNGMQLIVLPDHRAPVAVQMLWVRAGATDEVDGSSGLAHALEHMLFKGTPTVPSGAFSRRIAALGGSDNAFTSRDYTAYYQQVPVSSLKAVMQLEADRFANTRWGADDFATEMQVIREERRQRLEDSPRALLHEAMNATMYAATPYGRPIIGWMGDLEELTSEELLAFYRKWYQPANVALIVVGDVDVRQVRAWTDAYYGKIPAAAVASRKKRAEPVQKGIKRMQYRAPAEQPYLVMTWQVPQVDGTRLADAERLFAINPDAPDAATADAYALNVLAAVLDGNSGARLPRALTQGSSSVADSVAAYMGFAVRGPGTFTIAGTPASNTDTASLEQAIRRELAAIAEKGISEAELQRVKIQWAAAQVYAQDSVMGKAQNLGRNWVLGWPLDADARVLKRLGQVTAADVQRVARKYFGDDRLTVAELVPQPLDAETAARQRRAAAQGDTLH